MNWRFRRVVESSHDSIMIALTRADGIQEMKNSHLTCLIINSTQPDISKEVAESLWKIYSSPHTHLLIGNSNRNHGQIDNSSYLKDDYSASVLNLFKFPGCSVEVNRPYLRFFTPRDFSFVARVMHELNNMYRKSGITKLILQDNTLDSLSGSFDSVNITEVDFLDKFQFWNAGRSFNSYEKLKNCNILVVKIFCTEASVSDVSKLKVLALNLKLGMKNDLTNYLKLGVTENIAYLDLSSNFLDSCHLETLTEAIKDSNVISLNLSYNCFDSVCAKLLAEVLPHTKITYIDLHRNSIGYLGYTYLMEVIDRTDVCWLSLSENDIERDLPEEVDLSFYIAPRNNTPFVFQMRFLFKELVSLNTLSDEFEFIIPREDIIINLEHYTSLIRYLLNTPFSNMQIYDIFYMINKVHDIHVLNRINAFISAIEQKFLSFFENNIVKLDLRFPYDSFVDLVRECNNLNFSDFVESSLYHRVLFYVDNARNILHPLIYKMLHEHKILLFSELLEPNKKEEILSYFEKHSSEFEGVQELIDLLDSDGGLQGKNIN